MRRLPDHAAVPLFTPMFTAPENIANAAGLRIGLAVSRYHAPITEAMCEAAIERFIAAGGSKENLNLVSAPGAFELTAIARAFAVRDDIDAVVALGCVISGETTHDQYIASAVAQGLTMITAQTGVPVSFGVLTCQTLEQAQARSGGAKGNKGAEAMTGAIEAACAIRLVRCGPKEKC